MCPRVDGTNHMTPNRIKPTSLTDAFEYDQIAPDPLTQRRLPNRIDAYVPPPPTDKKKNPPTNLRNSVISPHRWPRIQSPRSRRPMQERCGFRTFLFRPFAANTTAPGSAAAAARQAPAASLRRRKHHTRETGADRLSHFVTVPPVSPAYAQSDGHSAPPRGIPKVRAGRYVARNLQ